MTHKKNHTEEMREELDVIMSKINALEAAESDREKKSLLTILKMVVENQKHLVAESDHIKKALDLLTAQLFKIDTAKN